MVERSSHADPRLPERLAAIDDDARRRIAHAVALVAVDHTQLDDPRLCPTIAALRAGGEIDLTELDNVGTAVDELDTAAFDAGDRFEDGTGSKEDYLRAFFQARAASAVLALFDPDSIVSVEEVIYEAYSAANDDFDVIRDAVKELL